MAKRGNIDAGTWIWPAIAVLMLVGMTVEASRTHVVPADADTHHKASDESISNFPMSIKTPGGTWDGRDVEVEKSATQLLKPNKILSREYDRDTGNQHVTLLIVDCRDARDLQGHYPPNCYPAQGEQLISSEAREWDLPHMKVPGMEYHFAPQGELSGEKVVYNFFVTPRVPGLTVTHKELDGVICTDIDSVYKSGEDYQRHYFGAAEFQLVTGAEMTREQRDQAFVDLLTPNENIIWTLENRDSGGN